MMRKNDIFNDNKTKKVSLKYFISAFACFLVILAGVSAFLFMRSIDYDLGNLVGDKGSSTAPLENTTESTVYSVNGLKGRASVLFVCEDEEHKLQFAFTVDADFDSKSILVCAFNENYSNSSPSFGKIYEEQRIYGIKNAVQSEGISVDKYVVFDKNGFVNFFKGFDGITVNVKKSVNYKSDIFNLQLDAGSQTLSAEYLYKYLLVSDRDTVASAVCDITSALLLPKYTENSERLFNTFVNGGETDISVIDYSDFINNLIVYSKAEDKFLPQIKQ